MLTNTLYVSDDLPDIFLNGYFISRRDIRKNFGFPYYTIVHFFTEYLNYSIKTYNLR